LGLQGGFLKLNRQKAQWGVGLCCFLGGPLGFFGGLFADPSVNAPPVFGTGETDALQQEFSFFNLKKNIRIQAYTDYSIKAIKSSGVPLSDGSVLGPALGDGRAWIEYAVTSRHRLLFWQPFGVDLSILSPSSQDSATMGLGLFSFRDPRIGYRIFDIFDSKTSQAYLPSESSDAVPFFPLVSQQLGSVLSVLDIYWVPKLYSSDKAQQKKTFEFGMRSSSVASFSTVPWDFGLMAELNYCAFHDPDLDSKFSGFAAPWAGFRIFPTLTTFHSLVVLVEVNKNGFNSGPFKEPFVGNGLNWSVTKVSTVTFLVNNFVSTMPSLSNTWFSVWYDISIL
jgi:hypothetical protein